MAMTKKITILGIESSCDDTSASVIQNGKVLSNVVATQDVHIQYGGVVPELASRAHQQNIVPVVQQAIAKANIAEKTLSGIAYTRGPGLMGSLLVGSSFAKSYALSLGVPLLEVNHLQAHILCHFIEDASEKKPSFPFICLTVSGGHTQIVLVRDYFDMEILGTTIDDAAGEAFDKIGKTLGLDYPAGPIIDSLSKEGNEDAFVFTEPKVAGFDFSFSGLKTAVLYFLQKEEKTNPNFVKENLADICASVQKRIATILLNKLMKAAEAHQIKTLAIAGGVSANSKLGELLREKSQEGYQIHIPKLEYTTDNAAMIAMVGSLKFERSLYSAVTDPTLARYPLVEQTDTAAL